MFGSLGLEIKELGAVDLDALSDEELADAVVALQRHADALQAEQARVVAAFDARRVWTANGAQNATQWLAVRTHAPKTACRTLVRLGRQLRDMPLVAAAWQAGDIGIEHVRLVARARNPRTLEAFAEAEAFLVDQARILSHKGFARVLDYWLLRTDPDGASENDIDRRDRRRVSLDQTIAGMWSGNMLLDPIAGAVVANELRRLDKKLFEADWALAMERLGHDPHVTDLDRTPDQRRADALVEMARRSTRPDDQAGSAAQPLFTLLLGAAALGQTCELEATGTVVSPTAVRHWIDDARIERVLFDGTPDRAIGISRQRSFRGALRRLIQVRDRWCYHPYCDQPAVHSQIDHIDEYGRGGLTGPANGRPACGFHNRDRNNHPPPDDG